ncbi:MAG: homocysteine S-methyltransferase family protein, partial [Ardenticatenaceae bacterium]
MIELSDRIARGEVIIMDGGTGTELEKRGVPMNKDAWNAAALLTHPHIVQEVHEDYIRAGADIIITNTFSTSRHVLEPAGLGEHFEKFNREAARIACRARDMADRPIYVAGGISTTTFHKTQPAPEVARVNFTEQAELFAEAGCDLIILEMMRDIEYTKIALEAGLKTGLPVWIGLSPRIKENGPTLILLDEPLADSLQTIATLGGSVMGIMHTLTEEIDASLPILKEKWSGPMMIYAHSGQFIMPNWQFIDMITPQAYAAE